MNNWQRKEELPLVKYELGDDTIHIESLVKDIVANFGPIRKFNGYHEYEDHVGEILKQLWPSWMEYIPPFQLFVFLRTVRNAIRKELPDISF